eukprot:743623-Amphidinium_carterae.1
MQIRSAALQRAVHVCGHSSCSWRAACVASLWKVDSLSQRKATSRAGELWFCWVIQQNPKVRTQNEYAAAYQT